MTCSSCGCELPTDAMFCGECGRSTAAPPVRPSPPAPAVRVAPVEPANDIPEIDPARLVDVALGEPTVGEPIVREYAVPEGAVAPTLLWDTGEPQIDDLEHTRIVDRSRSGTRFVLQFSTGEGVTVFGSGLVGRHPIAEPGERFDNLVTLLDPGKSVSKTHLEFGQDAGYFWVSDRFSGNGTIVREPDLPPKQCEPGKRYRAERGTRIDIGEQFFIVS